MLELRQGLPLADCSTFELMSMMRSAGWLWRQWHSKSAKRKCLQVPEGYVDVQDKHWFTPSTFVRKPYLLTWVCARDVSTQGLAMVPHGKDKRVYEQIWQGNVYWRKVASRCRKALTTDVDQDDAPKALVDINQDDASEEPPCDRG